MMAAVVPVFDGNDAPTHARQLGSLDQHPITTSIIVSSRLVQVEQFGTADCAGAQRFSELGPFLITLSTEF
jgi:hypothetical protein